MKVFDEYKSFVGYAERINGKLTLFSGNLPTESVNDREYRILNFPGLICAKDVADWMFAADVITVLGIFIYYLTFRSPTNGIAWLLLPNAALLMGPFAHALRFLAALRGSIQNRAMLIPAMLYVLMGLNALPLHYNGYGIMMAFLIGLAEEGFAVFMMSRILSDYLDDAVVNYSTFEFSKSYKKQKDIITYLRERWEKESEIWKFCVFFLGIYAGSFVIAFLTLMIYGGDSSFSKGFMFFAVGIQIFRMIEALQFFNAGKQIRRLL